ncbi:cell filamentation protein Fic [Bifidobacterium aemilianum]|uniref:Cell filamentation protein Fic n=1 Tax=Bifidobacterium aemilianum TaxID=2493120 RepID=A0A366K6Y9_9BIFI|nr:Fic family protein [Bifidobacterium aemilianum]RBP97506.1 cell filamentation protein Fic [Bifidobacterium aemilianum]
MDSGRKGQRERGGSPLATVKGLAGLLYRMGRTFDGLNSSYLATEDFLRTGNPKVLGSKNDLALLSDLTDASRYLLAYDYRNKELDLGWFCAINAHMSRTAAIEPGALRTSANIIVATRRGPYTPPIPRASLIQQWLKEATHRRQSSGLRAATLFARLAKAQPFGDGNKRSALLAANGLLLKEGAGAILAVPADGPEVDDFNLLLTNWYLDGDETLIGWLDQWNQSQV